MRHCISVVTTIVLIVSANIAEAGAITYAIENYPADQEGYTFSGTITTDGVIGGLASSDIVSWSWTISYPGEPPVTFSSSDPNREYSWMGPSSRRSRPSPSAYRLNQARIFSSYIKAYREASKTR